MWLVIDLCDIIVIKYIIYNIQQIVWGGGWTHTLIIYILVQIVKELIKNWNSVSTIPLINPSGAGWQSAMWLNIADSTFVQGFLEILKLSLQHFQKILKKDCVNHNILLRNLYMYGTRGRMQSIYVWHER